MGKGLEFGFSTSCFLDHSPSGDLEFGLHGLMSEVTRRPYLPEVEASQIASEELGLGLEVVYRKNASDQIFEVFKEKRVLQVHGPLWYDLGRAFREGWGEARRTYSFVYLFSSFFVLGTLERDFPDALSLSRDLEANQVVLHPNGAQILHKEGILSLFKCYGVNLAIEPDRKSPHDEEASYLIWKPEEVLGIAKEINEGVCLDTSHTTISNQSAEYLCQTYDTLKKAPKGVKAIHLSAAIPNRKDPWEVFKKKRAALPLDPRIIPPWILSPFREFYQHLLSDHYQGPIIVELIFFEKKSFDQRLKAIEVTLNSLQTSSENNGSLSLPEKPTQRPL